MLSSGGNGAAQYVEVLDTFSEPFPVVNEPYRIVVYDASGTRLAGQDVPGTILAGMAQPVLLGTPQAQTALGVTPDAALTVALPAAGKVCFTQGPTEMFLVNCVTWSCIIDSLSLQRTSYASETLVQAAPTPKAANAGSGGARDDCPPPPQAPPPGGDPQPQPQPEPQPQPQPPSGGGQTLPPLRDATKPVLSKIAVDAKHVAVTVSEAGTVTVTIERKVKSRFTRVKRLTLKATKAGALKAKLPTLSAGSYRITIVAKDAAGNVSRTTTRTVTVKPKKKP